MIIYLIIILIFKKNNLDLDHKLDSVVLEKIWLFFKKYYFDYNNFKKTYVIIFYFLKNYIIFFKNEKKIKNLYF